MYDDDYVASFNEARLPDFFGHQQDMRSCTAYLLLYERVAAAPPLPPLALSGARSPPTSPPLTPLHPRGGGGGGDLLSPSSPVSVRSLSPLTLSPKPETLNPKP